MRAENDTHRLSIYYADGCNPRGDDNLGTMVCWHGHYDLGDKHDYIDGEAWLRDLADKLGIDTEVNDKDGYWQGRNMKEIYEDVKKQVVMLPLYLLDHSGLTMSTRDFHDKWDSGQVGWIYATHDRLRKETGYTEKELFSSDIHRTPIVGERVKIEGREEFAPVRFIDDEKVVIDYNSFFANEYHKPENVVTVKATDIVEVLSNRAVDILKAEVELYDQYLRNDVYGFLLEEKKKCEHCGHTEYEHIDSCSGFFGTNFKENGLEEYIPEEAEELISELKHVG